MCSTFTLFLLLHDEHAILTIEYNLMTTYSMLNLAQDCATGSAALEILLD